FFLLTSKPTIFACNVAESDLATVAGGGDPGIQGVDAVIPAGVTAPGYNAAKRIAAVEDYARHHFATEAIMISAQIESELVDLAALGSFAKAREAGKLRLEGKDYVVQDGDVIFFRFNV